MQVTETSADGLKREFHIVVPAGELEDKVQTRLDELGRTIQLPGFRPGKVPMQILRRRYGPAVFGEIVESTVQDSSAETIREHNLRPALPPKLDLLSVSQGADLEYNMQVEILPEIPEQSFADFGIERLVIEVPEETVDAALGRIAEQQRKAVPVERAAADGDIVVVDVEGHVGGEAIPGASGKDRQILLGAGGFIPGFEEQLHDVKAGEHREIRVTFPEDYAVAHLAGKEAVFQVDVKEVRERQPAVIDDQLAEAVGLENLAELRDELRQQMERDYAMASRLRLKRALLDKLAERYDFPVPVGMVDLEFDNIWAQHEAERAAQGQAGDTETDQPAAAGSAASEGETEAGEIAGEAPRLGASEMPGASGGATAGDDAAAPGAPAASDSDPSAAVAAPDDEAPGAANDDPDAEAKAEYRKIAERRVRLGLLLAEVGRSNNITVTQDELNQAITREVRRHPGYERQALDYYRQNPEAVASLRAPIFEDKVVDFIVELAKVPERRISPEELSAMPDVDEEEAAEGSSAAPATG